TFGGYFGNAGSATSKGAELSVEVHPMTGLSLGAWVAWNQAELTDNLPANTSAIGSGGDRLPYSARLSGSFFIDSNIALTNNLTAVLGGSVSYVGDRPGDFLSVFSSSNTPRLVLPAFAKTDLHAGLRHAGVTVNIFATNITDRRGVVAARYSLP